MHTTNEERGKLPPAGKASPRMRGRIVAVWAIWSTGVLLLAAASAALPTGRKNPWDPHLAAVAPPLVRWDAGWYLGVVEHGYTYRLEVAANNIRFYPLYPLLTRLLWRMGVPLVLAGIVVSLASLLGALLLAGDLLAERSGAESVIPGLATLLMFPTAFYYAAYYTESLFLLTTVAAFWAARRGRWVLAALAGAAASLTRLNGLLIVVPMAWLVWESAGHRWRGLRLAQVAALGGTLGGAAAYPIFLWARFGSPLLFFRSEGAGWAHRPTPVWRFVPDIVQELTGRLGHIGSQGSFNFFAGFGCLVLFLILTAGLFRRREWAGALYAAATLLLLLNSGSLDAIIRYLLPVFPCLFLLADFLRRRPVLAFAYALVGTGLLVTLVTRFVHWIWVA